MDVRPFRGLRPRADLAQKIASPPYDVMNSAEARDLAGDDPFSFLHVIKAEIDLAPNADPYDDAVYARARANLDGFVERGWLQRDTEPAYYLYRLTMDGISQTGWIGAAAIADYQADRIKKHEHTRPAKESDRIRLNLALHANPGPVFLTYRPDEALDRLAASGTERTPDVDFIAPDGVRHELWVVNDAERCEQVATAFANMPATYVADGHHRASAAAQAGARLLDEQASSGAASPAGYFLAAHFPSNQLRVLDYNRVIRDLNGLDESEFLAKVRDAGFRVGSDYHQRKPQQAGTFGLYLKQGGWYELTTTPQADDDANDVVAQLDISVLSDRILTPILGIGDPRTDPRIDFVGGARGMNELERRVDSGADAVAFAVYPTRLEDVMRVADAGKVMPPKSTWFEPKLRSGLVVQKTDGDRL